MGDEGRLLEGRLAGQRRADGERHLQVEVVEGPHAVVGAAAQRRLERAQAGDDGIDVGRPAHATIGRVSALTKSSSWRVVQHS